MVIAECTVLNEHGLHARVAAKVVRECRKFQSTVIVQKDGKSFDLKSVMGVMTCGAREGDVLTVEVTGEDEQQTSVLLKELFGNKFGE